jgi:hypothetical protein
VEVLVDLIEGIGPVVVLAIVSGLNGSIRSIGMRFKLIVDQKEGIYW